MHELQDRIVKAVRQDRPCEWCGEIIPKGTSCQYRVYVMDEFLARYMHHECYKAMRNAPYWIADSWSVGSFQRGTVEEK